MGTRAKVLGHLSESDTRLFRTLRHEDGYPSSVALAIVRGNRAAADHGLDVSMWDGTDVTHMGRTYHVTWEHEDESYTCECSYPHPCEDESHMPDEYVGIVVTDVLTGDDASLWGIGLVTSTPSQRASSSSYVWEVFTDLASECWHVMARRSAHG